MARFFAFVAAAFLLASITPAIADPRKPPTVEYMLEYATFTLAQPQVTGKIWYTERRSRSEENLRGGIKVTIFDKVNERILTLWPEKKTYKQESYLVIPADDGTRFQSPEWQITRVGEEIYAGVPTTKWEVRHPDAKILQGFVWTTKENIQVRSIGERIVRDDDTERDKLEKTWFDTTSLKIGPVDPKLFEIPPDYKREN